MSKTGNSHSSVVAVVEYHTATTTTQQQPNRPPFAGTLGRGGRVPASDIAWPPHAARPHVPPGGTPPPLLRAVLPACWLLVSCWLPGAQSLRWGAAARFSLSGQRHAARHVRSSAVMLLLPWKLLGGRGRSVLGGWPPPARRSRGARRVVIAWPVGVRVDRAARSAATANGARSIRR